MRPFFKRQSNTIYVDLDGVLSDFQKFIVEHIGRPYPIAGDDPEMWDFVSRTEHIFLNLDPTPYAFELWEHVNSFGERVEILSAIPRKANVPTAFEDKRAWVDKYLGPDVIVKFGPYSCDKWKHATRGDLLIDDHPKNVTEWINNGGGIAVLHEDFKSTQAAVTRLVTERD